MTNKPKAIKWVESTPGRGVHRGPCLPDWFHNTETLDEVSGLLDRCVRIDEVIQNPTYSAEAIERMVRARVIRFCQEDASIPELPKTRDLQNWQEWFIRTGKTKDTEIDTETKEQTWRDDTPEYTSNANALRIAKNKISGTKLNKLLRTKDNDIRWMQNRKTKRSKVHTQDFDIFQRSLKTSDTFSEKAFEQMENRQNKIDKKKKTYQ